jgi:hypothetical protein
MIIKLLYLKKSGAHFPGVRYNTNKVDRNKGELMKVANFGALQGLANLRPQDYINYLKAIAALNTNVRKPQFHAVISGKGKQYDKERLTKIAENWLREMGYGDQPYLIIHHKDTENNHVHLVSCRVDKQGHKIDSAYEKIRSQKSMSKVLGYDYALSYNFSTRSQFFMLLEQAGYLGLDPDEKKLAAKIAAYEPNAKRTQTLKDALLSTKDDTDFIRSLKEKYGVELLFHATENKTPYGYTIIDHHHKSVFKGSEVLPLKQLLNPVQLKEQSANQTTAGKAESGPNQFQHVHIQSIWIADDVDDQQVHGMRRRRQKKARTNTR